MTTEQMQHIAEREYPYENGSFVSDPYENSIIEKKRDAFKHGLTYSKWIAVEDGLPERSEKYKDDSEIVQIDTGNTVSIGYYSFAKKRWFCVQFGWSEVIAWQERPEPYKQA